MFYFLCRITGEGILLAKFLTLFFNSVNYFWSFCAWKFIIILICKITALTLATI